MHQIEAMLDRIVLTTHLPGSKSKAAFIPLRSMSSPKFPMASMQARRKAMQDYILQPTFAVAYIFLSFTVVRLFYACLILPLYLLLAFSRSILPSLLGRAKLFVDQRRHHVLSERGVSSRRLREEHARQQLDGTYSFPQKAVYATSEDREVMRNIEKQYNANREYISVCDVKACVVHEVPRTKSSGGIAVLLHGNPSWSFMYRHVIPQLLKEGIETFALDWVGFGASDKPFQKEEISFELHMRTLQSLFEHYQLRNAHILAHDWGGCVALCTIPTMPTSSVAHITLLNSFFPPRVSDISLSCYFLYLLWLSATGILDGLQPEAMVMRYMAPSTTAGVISGYCAPFPSSATKAGVSRFAHIVPGMPSIVYQLFDSYFGIIVDGICPWTTFSSLHEQSRLRCRDEGVRKLWAGGDMECRVNILFGQGDPLLRDFYQILVDGIMTKAGKAEGNWILGAGHYPAEEQPEAVVGSFLKHVKSSGPNIA